MATVEIYYSRICGLCAKTIDFFRERGITFTAYAVEWDGAKDEFTDSGNARAMYKRCGEKVDFVPQIFIGTTHVKGWRKLEPMIDSGEFDALLQKPE